MTGFSSDVCDVLKNYVYGLVDPRDSKIFYVGKASFNNRAWMHLREPINDSRKSKRIAEIRAAGFEPEVEVLRYGLEADTVLEVEAALIDAFGFETLTNKVRGHGIERGRLSVCELEQMYGAKPIELSEYAEPVILFFISQTFSPTLDSIELYDSVRQFWRIGAHARTVDPYTGKLPYRLAVGVVDSVAVAVYSIEAWFPAESTVSTRTRTSKSDTAKWEFVGKELPDHVLNNRFLLLNDKKIIANQTGFKYFFPEID
ncbi:LEM-3-like GIY-YIG domain-containing protein [Alcaligenes faecalis]|uniref:GIY-YIG domain-containing protein n=1 Tax=Alcaligenes faecalis TaxID=511 RepID=A0A2U2BHA1_ALCFA|nr:hypothetical protein [Alcaligenes faecalis]PWE13395.1 hypothetical protein DF183_16440 [Alcaligenes faecalis]